MKISGEEKKGPVEYIKLLKEKWRTLLILICTAVILFSLFNIFHQFRDYNRSELIYSDIKKIYYNNSGLDFSDGDKSISSDGDEASFSDGDSKNSTVNSTEWDSYDSSAAPSIPPTGSEPVTSPTPEDAGIVYKDPRIERQTFDKLYKINKDIAGWIKIPGTNIDYPVLKGKDNDYYLTHSVNHEVIKNASIFMDYRNNVEKPDFNTIIYGHNMHDGSMFGYLPMYKEEWFFKKYPYIYFDTAYVKGKWEIFSVYVTDTDFNYLDTGFGTEDECQTFIDTIKPKSMFKKDILVAPGDRILTLSTCSYEFKNARTVVHVRLIKQ